MAFELARLPAPLTVRTEPDSANDPESFGLYRVATLLQVASKDEPPRDENRGDRGRGVDDDRGVSKEGMHETFGGLVTGSAPAI